ncbi:MAG: hypothetical protein M3N09_05640 [Actinomycetota bacterium]|nr:hypothetical protein [Actinomycetota bacterium]
MSGSGTSVGASKLLLLDKYAVLVVVSALLLQGAKSARFLREPHRLRSLPRVAAERPG